MVVIIFFLVIVNFISKRKLHIWLPSYFKEKLTNINKVFVSDGPIHIMFCLVDHYEPGWNKADLELQNRRVFAWYSKYPKFAQQFKDSDGFHPRHTWFYPPHYFREEHILKLISLCNQGYGELEMHLHHNRMIPFPDTPETLTKKILDCINLYSKYGVFKTTENGLPVFRYAFIHGDWALDNSRTGFCGVNNEISILKETGCYADFTFPSYMFESQPQIINSIYYAKDDPNQPKSYNNGKRVSVEGDEEEDLMMVQGPLGFRWKGRKKYYIPNVDDGEIASDNLPIRERVDFWIKTGIHIIGQPNWIFIKAYTHGAPMREHHALLEEPIISMHSYLKKKYNDGKKYNLHYVSARELYNIVKAAEAGYKGNPGEFRDFLIKPYKLIKKL